MTRPDSELIADHGRVRFPPWDQKLPKSRLLSDYDMRVLVTSISSALHYATGTADCATTGWCAMCGNAVRLVIQNAEQKFIEAFVRKTATALGLGLIDLHPRLSDD